MSSQRRSPATDARADHQRSADVPAPPRWLAVARMVWAVTALLALAVLVASIPGYVLAASQSNFIGHVVEAPTGLGHVLDLASALASFAAALVCLILAGLLYWRKPGNGMVLFVSFYLLVYGIVLAGPVERLDALIPGSFALATNVLEPLLFTWPFVALLVLFPTGRLVPSWTRWVLLLEIPPTLLPLYVHYQNASPWLIWPASIYFSLIVGASFYAQVYRYRHVSSPTERQQTKWALSGLVAWVLLNVAAAAPYAIFLNLPPGAVLPWWVHVGTLFYSVSQDIVPLTLTVALLRYRLFDIDVLIRRTLVYGTLTSILGAVYVAGVLGGQVVVQALTGQTGQQTVFIVASTLLVATLFSPLRRRLQAVIDERFYRRRYVAAQTLAAFGATLRTEMDVGQLSKQLVAVVQVTMQPAHVSLWLSPPSNRSPGEPSRPIEPVGAWIARRASADSAESI